MDLASRIEPPYPSASRGWLLVAVLVAAYALSFVDRQILSLLVGGLKADLHISDTQIGMLQGPAFGLFYALLGMPFGWLADKVDRLRLIAVGMLLWTVMTTLCGFADSYPMLFLARMGVGVGEAALVPAAVSLLADSFAPQRRAMPLSIFTAGISVGVGLSLVLSGALIAFANSGAAAQLPVIGPMLGGRAPWQIVLMLAGLGGLPLGLLILCLPGPARRAVVADRATDGISLAGWLRQEKAIFVPLLVGTSLLYLFTNALAAWMPTLFVRGFGWAPAMVGTRLGIVILICALAGNLLSGGLAGRLLRAGRANATLLTMTIGAGLLVPAAVIGPLLPSALLAQAAIAAIYFATALCFGVATASFVAVTPPAIRGQMIALYLLLGNLIGLVLGPPSVGYIVQHILQDPAKVGVGLALVALVSVAPGFWLIRRALGPHAVRARAMAR